MKDLLAEVAERATAYLGALPSRKVTPSTEAVCALGQFEEPLPSGGMDAKDVMRLLDDLGSPGTVASAGGRYYGFVIGGALPATLAANWLAGAWDQNAGGLIMSPSAAAIEQVAMRWVLEALGLPENAAVGFATGATMANFMGLAAARHALLKRQGWDVESQGLFGAPPITVVVGEEVHVSALKALALLGLGRDRVEKVPVDGQGRMRAEALPALSDATIVCLQAGNVNTGAFDPASEICTAARERGAWVHVDGAFGLWAAAAPERAHLTAGLAQADSWATDAHKWLNVPYDCGIAMCRHPELFAATLSVNASYLVHVDQRDAYTPEMSRRARGVEVWAALKSLGRSGLAEMIERHCRQATRFADGLREAGHAILNEVRLNQVLVSFGNADTNQRVIDAIQADGTCWCGGTTWQGRSAMRISVSSWATTDDDVERSLEAMLRIAAEHCQ